MNALHQYAPTLYVMGLSGGLLLLQLIVADLSAIRAGHTAGTPIPADFSRFYFRAARAHANTNESLSAFGLLAITGVLSGAAAGWLNVLSVAYLLSRVAHMVAYYANRKTPRSTAFGISLLVLIAMFVTNVGAWLR
jgi:uncharacterized MAPEG superfamily protein